MIVTPWDPNTIPFEAGMIGEICVKKLYQREATTPFSKIFCICAHLSPWRHNGHDHRVRQIWRVHLSLLISFPVPFISILYKTWNWNKNSCLSSCTDLTVSEQNETIYIIIPGHTQVDIPEKKKCQKRSSISASSLHELQNVWKCWESRILPQCFNS